MPQTDDQADVEKPTTDDDEATCRIIVGGKVVVERTSEKVGACLQKVPKT